ncbi:MAG: FkbM family methyltransferase [Rhodocyclaceae bacterium]|nr:FkbM family methyltransferase [Rhodocyclaceae bacterium]
MNNYMLELLQPLRLTEVVDIGANPIDGEPPYQDMLQDCACRVTGFEPQAEALKQLQESKGSYERYLPYAIGDGKEHTLHICRASGMTSLLEPDESTLKLFEVLLPLAEVIEKVSLKTKRLDDVDEITTLDFLKIDIQGSELSVFQHGKRLLEKAVCIQTEVSFVPLYKNQPTLGDIDIELRQQGFIPHTAAAIKNWPIAPCIVNNNPYQPLNQLLEADLVYVRDFSKPEKMDDEQLKHLALIAHYCYGSIDLTMRCIMLLSERQVLASSAVNDYTNWLIKEAQAAAEQA